jgi:FKBP-type peptidyl-prolyl cis-trans isomerase
MRRVLFVTLALIACQKADDSKNKPDPSTKTVTTGSGSAGMGRAPLQSQQVPPPLDIKNPPPDVVKTPSGLVYKKLVTNDKGATPGKNDTVMINFTGWKQSTGETFFTNKSRGQPMPLNLTATAPGFTEAMQLLKKGERAVLWLPPSIGYKGPPQGNPETLVYEVEVVDIVAAPPIPADVGQPPATAEKTKNGIPFVVLRAGTGKDKAKPYDNVKFLFSAWDHEGKMFDSTEMKKRPSTVPPYRQPAPLEEILTSMTAGERLRFWIDAEKMTANGHPLPGMPTGVLCYEIEVESIEPGVAPPETPTDVAKPPADAKKTAKGVSYKVLKAGKGGPHPKPTDTVKVHYSGWTTDGKMFDSSVTRNQPAEFSLQGVIAGWTDGIPVMSVGDKTRFWIPEELAYKGSPGKPQGMLVFDVELLEIKDAAHPDAPPPPHGGPPHGMPPHTPPPGTPPGHP